MVTKIIIKLAMVMRPADFLSRWLPHVSQEFDMGTWILAAGNQIGVMGTSISRDVLDKIFGAGNRLSKSVAFRITGTGKQGATVFIDVNASPRKPGTRGAFKFVNVLDVGTVAPHAIYPRSRKVLRMVGDSENRFVKFRNRDPRTGRFLPTTEGAPVFRTHVLKHYVRGRHFTPKIKNKLEMLVDEIYRQRLSVIISGVPGG